MFKDFLKKILGTKEILTEDLVNTYDKQIEYSEKELKDLNLLKNIFKEKSDEFNSARNQITKLMEEGNNEQATEMMISKMNEFINILNDNELPHHTELTYYLFNAFKNNIEFTLDDKIHFSISKEEDYLEFVNWKKRKIQK